MYKRRAFTLIELMIVIAIIALLMAILVPAIERVRKQAKDITCRSNLHQWGIIWKMFIDDHGGQFTKDSEWITPLRPYYSRDPKVALCPRAVKPFERKPDTRGRKFHAFVTETKKDIGFPNGMVASYGYNQWCTTEDTGGSRPRALLWTTAYVKSAYNLPVMIDATHDRLTPYHADIPPTYDGEIYYGGTDIDEMRCSCIDRHNETVNCTFGDWSARAVGLKELWELRWHRRWYYGKGGTPNYAPPVWPEWMHHMKDYARK